MKFPLTVKALLDAGILASTVSADDFTREGYKQFVMYDDKRLLDKTNIYPEYRYEHFKWTPEQSHIYDIYLSEGGK